MKKIINYIKSLGWGKEDVKKILMLIIMLLIACVILNKFLKIEILTRIGYGDISTEITKGLDDAMLHIENASPVGFKIYE